jgi:hypothetical protein
MLAQCWYRSHLPNLASLGNWQAPDQRNFPTMGGQHIMVSRHLTHDFAEQRVSIVYNFNALEQSNKERKHKRFFCRDANAPDPERTAHDQNTLITNL